MISELNFYPAKVLGAAGDGSKSKFPLALKIFGPGTDKRAIYALRYRAFLDIGVITPRTDALFFDRYDDLETAYTIGAFNSGVCVGSFRLTFGTGTAGSNTMPCQSVFTEVAQLEADGFANLVEFTRMVVAPELSNTSFRTTLYAALVRAGLIVAHAARADYGLISVHPDLVRFYGAMCGFRSLARSESYPGINAPAVLMGRNFRALDQKRTKQNPFFRIAPAEIASARATLFSPSTSVPEVALA